MKLLKKYGRSILTQKYLDEVKKTSSETADILAALKVSDKSKIPKIKTIIRLLKEKSQDYNAEFVVKLWDKNHYGLVKKFLDTKFVDSNIEQLESTVDTVKISGEGWFYKRSLEQDTKKLLGVSE